MSVQICFMVEMVWQNPGAVVKWCEMPGPRWMPKFATKAPSQCLFQTLCRLCYHQVPSITWEGTFLARINKITECAHTKDLTKCWSTINSLLGKQRKSNYISEFKVREKIITDTNLITEHFNKHFIDIGLYPDENDMPNETCIFKLIIISTFLLLRSKMSSVIWKTSKPINLLV